MAFFTKAAALAIQYHPSVNSMLDGEEIVNPQYAISALLCKLQRAYGAGYQEYRKQNHCTD
jgi:pyruvate/2-oxoglutarate dehydrogenase complex dihydrolipoamide acyltransferase (E2) component